MHCCMRIQHYLGRLQVLLGRELRLCMAVGVREYLARLVCRNICSIFFLLSETEHAYYVRYATFLRKCDDFQARHCTLRGCEVGSWIPYESRLQLRRTEDRPFLLNIVNFRISSVMRPLSALPLFDLRSVPLQILRVFCYLLVEKSWTSWVDHIHVQTWESFVS